MAIRIDDKTLESRIARIARKQLPSTNKRAMAMAMIDEACRRVEQSKDPEAWKAK